MPVEIWKMVQGDEEPVLRVRLQDEDELAIDAADVTTVVLELRQGGGAWTTLAAGGSVEQGDVDDVDAEGERYWYARFDWQSGDTDALSGTYDWRLDLTRSGGNTLHAPSGAPWNLLVVAT